MHNIELIEASEPIHLTIPKAFIGKRLDATLANIIPELSRNRITNWIKNGNVLINGIATKPKYIITGDEHFKGIKEAILITK